MALRLFLAVDLPDRVHRAAADAAGRLRARVERAPTRSRITWVSVRLLHLTLVFLGEMDEAGGTRVVERLREPLAVRPFALALGPAGTFPASGRPRVLWLSIAEGLASLSMLKTAAERRLDGIPFARDSRPYSPHLTLARFREGATADERRAVDAAAIAPSPAALVDHVTLYRSRLSPRGPEYTMVATTALSPESAA